MVALTSRKTIINVDVFHSILNIYIFLFCENEKMEGFCVPLSQSIYFRNTFFLSFWSIFLNKR